MAAPKMTMALASLLLSGVFAVTPYSDSQSTVTAEPQQIGTTTSNGILMYSMNYCTVIESTKCQVSLATATNAVPSAGYSAPVVEPTTQIVSVTSAVGETIIYGGEPAPTMVWSEATPGASQPSTNVVSTIESLGSPSLETNSILAATGSAAITSGTPTASGSVTGKQQTNSTSVLAHESPSSSITAASAPDRTNAGAALKAVSSVAFGAVAIVMAFFM
ncbi:hypothetical protein V8C42DRAFT_356734 [Trichoderma barbatum]